MKKVILFFVLLFTCQLAFCQSASSLFNDYKTKNHAEYVSVPKLLMSIAAAKVKDGNVTTLLKQIDEVKVLTLDDCKKKVRKSFLKDVSGLLSQGYTEFTTVNEGGSRESTQILVKEKDKKIKEVLAIESDKDDCVGILIKGNINPEDIAALIGMVEDSDD